MTLRSHENFEEKLTCGLENEMRNLANFHQNSWYWRVVQNLKKKQFFVSRMTRIWWILIRALTSLKNLHFAGTICAKYITFKLKKYRGVVIHDIEESWKFWRKTDLWFGKWNEEFGKFSSEHLNVSKLVLSWDPFV